MQQPNTIARIHLTKAVSSLRDEIQHIAETFTALVDPVDRITHDSYVIFEKQLKITINEINELIRRTTPVVDRINNIKPIDMILHCPVCQLQHIDEVTPTWSNPPHRSHECQGCKSIWRPADVPTNGVTTILTRGKADSV